MARRTPGLERVETILPKSIHAMGQKVETLYRRHFILWHWPDIVGAAIAANVHPQRIEFKKLYLYAPNAAWRNEIRMMQPQILQRVNNYAGEQAVKELVFTGRQERGQRQAPAIAAEEGAHLGRTLQKVNLTDAELAATASRCAGVEDDGLRLRLRRLLQHQQKLTRLKERQDWHRCADCQALCPPHAARCSICAARHEEEVRGKIRAILTELPWARHSEVSEYVPCTPAQVNHQRAAMVQQLASRVRLEDYGTLAAKTLVMLYRCLPPEQLTEDIVKRTLYRLRGDLARPQEFKPVKRYDFIGWGRKKGGGKKKQSGE